MPACVRWEWVCKVHGKAWMDARWKPNTIHGDWIYAYLYVCIYAHGFIWMLKEFVIKHRDRNVKHFRRVSEWVSEWVCERERERERQRERERERERVCVCVCVWIPADVACPSKFGFFPYWWVWPRTLQWKMESRVDEKGRLRREGQIYKNDIYIYIYIRWSIKMKAEKWWGGEGAPLSPNSLGAHYLLRRFQGHDRSLCDELF